MFSFQNAVQSLLGTYTPHACAGMHLMGCMYPRAKQFMLCEAFIVLLVSSSKGVIDGRLGLRPGMGHIAVPPQGQLRRSTKDCLYPSLVKSLLQPAGHLCVKKLGMQVSFKRPPVSEREAASLNHRYVDKDRSPLQDSIQDFTAIAFCECRGVLPDEA
eukprot:1098354-Pelagomonas_calceolata.AAC.4